MTFKQEDLISNSYVCTFRVINVYTKKHQNKKNGTVGKLGDRVLVAVLGQKKKGIIVGMKQKQRHAIPRYCTVLYCNHGVLLKNSS